MGGSGGHAVRGRWRMGGVEKGRGSGLPLRHFLPPTTGSCLRAKRDRSPTTVCQEILGLGCNAGVQCVGEAEPQLQGRSVWLGGWRGRSGYFLFLWGREAQRIPLGREPPSSQPLATSDVHLPQAPALMGLSPTHPSSLGTQSWGGGSLAVCSCPQQAA